MTEQLTHLSHSTHGNDRVAETHRNVSKRFLTQYLVKLCRFDINAMKIDLSRAVDLRIQRIKATLRLRIAVVYIQVNSSAPADHTDIDSLQQELNTDSITADNGKMHIPYLGAVR